MEIPFLQSERVYLKRLKTTDFGIIRKMNTNEMVMQYIRKIETLEETEAYFRKVLDYNAKNEAIGLGFWACYEKNTNRLIGRCVLRHFEYDEKYREIGYSLLPQFWGKGYATEIAKCVLQYGFEKLQLPKIIGVTHQKNIGSQKVLEKIGFSFIKEAFYYDTNVFYYEAINNYIN